jgi:competence protein ComEC
MSFAATTMLVAFYEWFRGQNFFRFYPSSSPAMRGLYKVGFYIAGTALTTLIAGLATSPFAAYYFQRIAVFSLVANVLALPVIGFIVMPAGLIALLAMPLGLDGYVLSVMGAGLDLVIDIASWTASLPNAVKITPAFSGTAMLLMVFGALWVCLWRTRWRLWGLVAIAAGLGVTPVYPLPDIYVAASGKNIAVRGADGLLVVAKKRRERFSVGKWLAREGDTVSLGDAAKRDGFRCDASGCIFKLKDDRLLSFAENLAAVEEDCRRVDILIAAVPIRLSCERPKVTIDKFDLWRNGAYTLSVSGENIVVRNALEIRGDRPWVRNRGQKRRYDTRQKPGR